MRPARTWLWPIGIALALLQIAAGATIAWLLGDASNVQVESRNAQITVAVTCVVLPLLTLIAAGWLHHRLNKAAATIVEDAKRIASGDVNHRAHAEGPFAGVADVINQVASQLRERIGLLEARLGEQRIIQESMSSGMVALDMDQRVLSMNKAAERLLKLSEAAAKGKPLRSTMHEPGLNRLVSQAIAQAERNHAGQVAGEVELFRSRALLQVSVEPLRNADGRIVGLLLLLSDVTRLRHLEKIRTDFAANVSHELRTPITNIKGYLETLIDSPDADPAQTKSHLGVMKRNADRLELIIEDLLKLARLEDPETVSALEKTEAELRPILEAAIAAFEETRTLNQIAINLDAPGELRAIINPQLLEQAVGNLLSNALKYSPAGSTIVVRAAARDSNEVELSVIDQGPGIAPEHLLRLFERFYRVDRARSRELGGTGLGLAIVKHIAQVHGGRAEVESKLGRGSTFRIILPAAG